MTNSAPEGAELRAWAENNPGASRDWRVLALQLASHADMPAAWVQLRKREVGPMRLHAAVCTAFRDAHIEVRRRTSKDEKDAVMRVIEAARKLRDAIEESPLPARTASMIELNPGQVLAWFGWRGNIDDLPLFGPAPALTAVDLCDLIAEKARGHLANRPPRSFERQTGKPLLAAFVRRLAFDLRESRVGPATLARIATAALDLADPVDKPKIERILRDSPFPR